MNTVWKWTLTHGLAELRMPADSKVLSVQMQGDEPQLWALVDDQMPLVERQFCIYGTGYAVPADHGPYVGTFQTHGGELVWHVFEKTK